jgi:hypothetical protein
MTRKEAFMSVLTVVIIIITAAIVGTLTEFGNFGIAQGQETLTAQQKAAMCDPSNPKLGIVNGTESEICGIPKTLPSSSANTTTGGGEEAPPPPPTSIAPSAVPPPED